VPTVVSKGERAVSLIGYPGVKAPRCAVTAGADSLALQADYIGRIDQVLGGGTPCVVIAMYFRKFAHCEAKP
jgi:hypothetical protein